VRAAAPSSFERLQAGAALAWRTLQYFALSRVLVASALLLSLATIGGAAAPFGVTGLQAAPLLLAGSVTYFGLSAVLAVAAFSLRQRFLAQVVGQLAVDLVLITALAVGGGGLRAGIIVLYLLPLAGASLLLPTSAAFFVCAVAVLSLLTDAALRAIGGTSSDSLLFQTGLFGAALFAVTDLLRLLSARLAEQERLAQLRGQDLENQLEINRLVIAQMEQGVLVVDASSRVRANNLAARALLGLPPTMQLTGRRLSEFTSLQPLTEAFRLWRAAERSSGLWSNTIMQSSGPPKSQTDPLSSQLALRARFARPPSDAGDEFVIFLEDVRAVEERAQQLKLAAMGRLTASIAHEIRNPLGGIRGAAQLLDSELDRPELREYTRVVMQEADRLQSLMDRMLAPHRLLQRKPVNVHEVLERVRSVILAEFPDGIRMRRDYDTSLPLLAGDREQLIQAVLNVVRNAAQAMRGRGSIELRTRIARSVTLARRRYRHAISIQVIDDGPGIAPEMRERIFYPLVSGREGGSGLGLPLAQTFISQHQGSIEFESEPGRTCFTMLLPITGPDEATAETIAGRGTGLSRTAR